MQKDLKIANESSNTKALKGYAIYKELIIHYTVEQVLRHVKSDNLTSLSALQNSLPENKTPESWVNVGGQLIKKTSLDKLH